MEVFTVPRGPAKRYACRTWSCSIALRSVRTTASCPTTSSKPCGAVFPIQRGHPTDLRVSTAWLGCVGGSILRPTPARGFPPRLGLVGIASGT
jgi:hypothetical protein